MRRLVVEYPLNELGTRSGIQRLKSFEIVHILRLEPAEFSALVRVNFGDKPAKIEDVFPRSHDLRVEYRLLEKEKEIYTYLLKISARPGMKRPQTLSELTSGASFYTV